MAKPNSSSIAIEKSLGPYFYERLNSLNKMSSSPVDDLFIFYSSSILEEIERSQRFFEDGDEGRREKILGPKLLEAESLSRPEKKRVLKDVGDTALLTSSIFSKSLGRKIIDASYYQGLGMSAYKALHSLGAQAYDHPQFYLQLAESFSELGRLMSILGDEIFDKGQNWEQFFIVSSSKTKAS